MPILASAEFLHRGPNALCTHWHENWIRLLLWNHSIPSLCLGREDFYLPSISVLCDILASLQSKVSVNRYFPSKKKKNHSPLGFRACFQFINWMVPERTLIRTHCRLTAAAGCVFNAKKCFPSCYTSWKQQHGPSHSFTLDAKIPTRVRTFSFYTVRH